MLRGDTYVTSWCGGECQIANCNDQIANVFSKATLLHTSGIELPSVLFICIMHNM